MVKPSFLNLSTKALTLFSILSGDWQNNEGLFRQAGRYFSAVKPSFSNLSTKALTLFSIVLGD